MTDSDIERFLHQMSKDDLDKWLRMKGQTFDSFANALAEGGITNLAPPFVDYANYNGCLLDYYNDFFQQYLHYLEKIDSKTWEFVDFSMGAFIKHYGGLMVDFDLVEECKMLMKSIMKSLRAYLDGSPNMAYGILEHAFLDKNSHLLYQ